ncbi:MAG: alpha-L-fucosidase [Bacteroidota bacterium]|nr:alpha-L-fucosidase [Bacteroidota bacterium]MDP4273029.1 alpha-L-fucosidase [Bacteroidota bacterium]
MKSKILFVSLFIILLYLKGIGQEYKTTGAEMKWWQESRFGMFIHWGPVTRFGGEISWSREGYGKAKYDSLYKGFNPIKFNPAEWVALAQKAGMKYMVFTAKHHDGFCEWNTMTTSYNIMNTPFGRDVCKELADAAHKAGMPICWYFSPADWKDLDCRNPKTNDVFAKRVLKQVRELLTNYGKISLLWIDYEGSPSPVKPKEIYELAKKLQPGIIVNNRLDVFHSDESHAFIGPYGDYATPEGFVAGYGAVPWETCTNLGHQWAWRPKDTPRPISEAATTLMRCAGGNGNLLLNVGPDSLGQIPEDFQERLIELGNWLKLHGQSVYNTKGGPYTPTGDYLCTFNGNNMYLNILQMKSDTLTLPAFPLKIVKASLINGKKVHFIQEKKYLKLVIPPSDREKISTLITFTIKEPLDQMALIHPFSTSGSLAYNCKASASSSVGQFLHDPSAAFDDNPKTYWKPGRRTDVDFDSQFGKLLNYRSEEVKAFFEKQGWLEADLGKPQTVKSIAVSELVFLNSEIKSFEIQYEKDGHWITIASETKMGDWKQNIKPVTAQKFRVVILERNGFSGIKEFQLFANSLN